jgi:hypothetical protein
VFCLLLKQALDKYRKDGAKLRCKACVADVEEAERNEAAAKRAIMLILSNETRACAKCKETLGSIAFNRNQWSKGEEKSKCRTCVEKIIVEEELQKKQFNETKFANAVASVEKAKCSGNIKSLLKAESERAAIEAEKVTGLKPVRMNLGRRGHGRSTTR